MHPQLARGIAFMVAALVLYTYAVFSGRRQGLHFKHLVAFGLGLASDAIGTMAMSALTRDVGPAPDWHHYSGVVSLGGMGLHFVLALGATLVRRADAINRTFHRVSLTIYTLWLLAFVSGGAAGMMKMSAP